MPKPTSFRSIERCDTVAAMTELPQQIAPATARAADGWPRKAWTHRDLDRMTEAGLFGPEEHVELVDGEIIPMPAEGIRHERVRLVLNSWIWRHIGRDKDVLPEAGWRPGPSFYLEPDFLIVSRTVVPPEFPGSQVLLAIEIADSSLTYDTGIKRERYAELGVREYWVAHAWEFTTRIYRAPIDNAYSVVDEHGPTTPLTPELVPELVLRLSDLGFDR